MTVFPKNIPFLIIMMAGLADAKAQDRFYSNANQSLLAMNPSFAGSNGGLRNQFSYRNSFPQFSGFDIAYNNALDGYIKKLNAGIGLVMSLRQFGVNYYLNHSVGLAYSQHLSIGKFKVMPSLEWRYCKGSVDPAGAGWIPDVGEFWSDSNIVLRPTAIYHDMSGGLMVQQGSLYVGISYAHFNHPHVGHYKETTTLPASLNIHVSKTYTLGTNCIVQGIGRVKGFGQYSLANIAVNSVLFNHAVLGVGCWTGNIYSACAGFRGRFSSFTLGYDMRISKLETATAGSWEFHWSVNLRHRASRNLLATFEEM